MQPEMNVNAIYVNAMLFENVTWSSFGAVDNCQLVVLVGRPKHIFCSQQIRLKKYFECWRLELTQSWVPRLVIEPTWDVVHVKLLVL